MPPFVPKRRGRARATDDDDDEPTRLVRKDLPMTRGYQQEMLDESLHHNIIIALDTGSGKTLIAVLRIKHELEREPNKIAWFFAPTVALCEQQWEVLRAYLPVSVGIVSGANQPDQWKRRELWEMVLHSHRVMVSTPQVLLDALRHGYINMARDLALMVFDEAHHAVSKHPYNTLMQEFYFTLPARKSVPPGWTGLVRPMILGLTASPIYGGNVTKAFETIEANLDSTIRAPTRHRLELNHFVHRPVFKHVIYKGPDVSNPPFSSNLAALQYILGTLNIEDDPYVISLREQLGRVSPQSPEYKRITQRLGKVLSNHDSFTHKGLRDFERAGSDICATVGPWAADWFVERVLKKAKQAANPFDNIMLTWKNKEKRYLLRILERIIISPVSYYPDDISDDCSDKVRALIECLLDEKETVEGRNERYSAIIFVQRRDVVIALTEVLKHHPVTKGVFKVGALIGTSESKYRHSVMDVTRNMVKESQGNTLAEFKIGEKNLIVSTAVAEEGIDIQACGSVIRWDPPENMASWAQSRGRARRERSTFTVMFQEDSAHEDVIAKWTTLERQMVELYNDPSRDLTGGAEDKAAEEDSGEEENDITFEVASTGAKLTLHSAISHLAHFCAIIPNTSHVDNNPLYEIDPPDFPHNWHTFGETPGQQPIYNGPFGSAVTLPRALPIPQRQFAVQPIYRSKISAHRHAAYTAYRALWDAGLLNDHLLPITSVLQPELEDEVKEMLADVEKRTSMAKVSMSLDPWTPDTLSPIILPEEGYWFCSRVTFENESIPPLLLLTRVEMISLGREKGGPVLYRHGLPPMHISVSPLTRLHDGDAQIGEAKRFTRLIFWALQHTRMTWDNTDFAYLFLPLNPDYDNVWTTRRNWLEEYNSKLEIPSTLQMMVDADTFGKQYRYPSDITLVQRHLGSGRIFRFIRWRHDLLSEDELMQMAELYKESLDDIRAAVTYPLLVVEPFPPRTNFLVPLVPKEPAPSLEPLPQLSLLPDWSGIVLLSPEETEHALLLPSILRSIEMSMTAHSLRQSLLSTSDSVDLANLPIMLLTTAITAPASGERFNYQRMETLGDTVLKFMTGLQILAEYPTWHEGYLTKRKDHAVSNVRLAKENIKRSLYRWIIRDIMLSKKWKPKYIAHSPPGSPVAMPVPATPTTDDHSLSTLKSIESEALDGSKTSQTSGSVMEKSTSKNDSKLSKESRKKKKGSQQLSTKVLADVVESLIGAAYLHGGLDLGYECIRFFDIGIKWEPRQDRIEQLLGRVSLDCDGIPAVLSDVETMLGYTFERKLLLIEALTHASYQQDSRTPSYERMEFLGDSVLDMIVTHFLYHALGKNYSPGHMHLRRSAVVNAHLLAYICLKTSLERTSAMPGPSADGGIEIHNDFQRIHFFKCLLHSSPKVLDDQLNAFTRFGRVEEEIDNSLQEGTFFPWAALTRLQAPKFLSDMVESVVGAIYLDSHGNLDVVRGVLGRLGIMRILERIVEADVDVLHPVSRLSLWGQKHGKDVEYVFEKQRGEIACAIQVDGVEEVRVSDIYRGMPSQEEVKFAAAERAITAFKLRNVNANYSLLKKVDKPKRKKKKAPAKVEGMVVDC